ncbi:TPA: opacity-associated protein OapA [Haemophilus influenzae]|uniref:opacity-associated protein OapA n=1 Tax=Haemophilus TaxID=724 RepID=UPI000039A533|nr:MULTISPECIES: opacity-associated protein OapA [Haemophilus]ADO95713.1 Opacity-associated protein A [Haemophilus influenzae R2846]MCK8819217.1 opacity-associated protein OapA [Haemophilus influenzae]MCK8996228.1 opacity-associated protein OapA [Haemophilus influenzae]BBF01569.1 opacity-associated protein OapA [Haemophilus influenzae]GBK88203.1 opacity-associated protein OapA [Haemophilus influenzae]
MNSMDKNEQSSQNELDLGLSQEPITPKKTIQPSSSILGKTKGLFAKKNHVQTNFQQRKEPTFGNSSTQENDPLIPSENLKTVQKPVLQTSSTEENISAVDEEISAENNADEPVEKAEKPILAQPEKWKILQVLPAKHRRLFMAIFVLVILLIIFFALKPSSDTVESFTQSNSNEIPVQFQSLDQSQPVETTILDNPPAQNQMAAEQANQPESAPKAEEAANNTTAQNQSVENTPMQQNVVQAPSQMPNEMAAASVMPMPPAQAEQPQMQPVQTQAEQPKPTVPVQPMKKAVEPQVVHKDTAKKEVKVAEKAQAPSKATEQSVAKTAGKAPIVEAKPVQVKKEKKVQIVDAKPVSKSTASRLAAKTLTVPKGVSLMQVFRDNQLNISDVNAMSKAAGAGNVLSSFKSGDKVTVSVNNQGRVNEMRLSNGARFVRQSDGSYQYKK